MKRIAAYGLIAACLLLPAWPARAQDKAQKEEAKPAASRTDGPQLKVQIVFSEYEGDKKVKSLPYTLMVLVGGDTNWSKMRIGDRVPVATGKEGGGIQFQYIDVGTNIDCRAFSASDGRFRLYMNLEKSWVQSDVPAATTKDNSVEVQFHQPTIRSFRTDTNVLLREGQAVETDFATDPVSGRVVRLEVTMNVMK
jgi:hypothetical protein